MRIDPKKKAVSLPRGDYRVRVIDSAIVRELGAETLYLRLSVFKRWTISDNFILSFCVQQRDLELEFRERARLQSLASAAGVYEFDDSEQLHDKPFMLTIWSAEPLRWSCRPMMEKSENVRTCPASVAPRGVDDDGPRAA